MMYETKGGRFSEDDTIMEMVDLLDRLADLANIVSHYNAEHSRTVRADGFQTFALLVKKSRENLVKFATKGSTQ
jgi:hypothetical protein